MKYTIELITTTLLGIEILKININMTNSIYLNKTLLQRAGHDQEFILFIMKEV
jgi:hypothetical protein